MNAISKQKILFEVFLTVIYCCILYNYIKDNNFIWFIDSFNLLIHESGHMFFNFLGLFIGVFGGTLMQILIPTLTIFIFLKQKDYFAIGFSIAWLGTNMFNVSRYVADAPYQLLTLVSIGSGDPIHDWNFILSYMGILKESVVIAEFLEVMGYFLLIVSIIVSIYTIFRQYSYKNIN